MGDVRVSWPKVGKMLANPVVRRAVDRAAEEIAAEARRWGEEHRVTGDYAAGIETEPGTARDGRPVNRVKATAPHSALVEYGTSDTPAFAPVRTAATTAGYRLGSRRA